MSLELGPIRVIGRGSALYEREYHTTQNGRLISEYSAGESPVFDAIYRRGIDMHLVPFSHSGFRHGMPTNEGARQEVVRNWKGVLDNLVWLHYTMEANKASTTQTLSGAYLLAQAGYCLSDFLFFRKHNAFGTRGELPDVIGDIPKVAAGFRTVTQSMMDPEINPDTTLVTPQELHDYAEEHELLRTREKDGEDRVCAMPESLIVKAAEALLYGKIGNHRDSILTKIIPEPEHFRVFATAYASLDSLYRSFGKLNTDLLDRMDYEGESPDEIFALYEDPAAAYLAAVNNFQIEINLALGYDLAEIPEIEEVDVEIRFGTTVKSFIRDRENAQYEIARFDLPIW